MSRSDTACPNSFILVHKKNKCVSLFPHIERKQYTLPNAHFTFSISIPLQTFLLHQISQQWTSDEELQVSVFFYLSPMKKMHLCSCPLAQVPHCGGSNKCSLLLFDIVIWQAELMHFLARPFLYLQKEKKVLTETRVPFFN